MAHPRSKIEVPRVCQCLGYQKRKRKAVVLLINMQQKRSTFKPYARERVCYLCWEFIIQVHFGRSSKKNTRERLHFWRPCWHTRVQKLGNFPPKSVGHFDMKVCKVPCLSPLPLRPHFFRDISKMYSNQSKGHIINMLAKICPPYLMINHSDGFYIL